MLVVLAGELEVLGFGRYYAYENWTRYRARVHCEGCPYLTSARSARARSGDIGANDRWHDLGEFATPGQAMAQARRRFRSDKSYKVAFCGRCVSC